jgi:hypothetical protein
MNNLEKLIQNGGWLPIEEAPKDGTVIWGKSVYSQRQGTIQWMYVEDSISKGHWRGVGMCMDTPTHFMPLDAPQRMAEVIKHYDAALRSLESLVFPLSEKSGVLAAAHEFIEKAIIEANKIAGGEDA